MNTPETLQSLNRAIANFLFEEPSTDELFNPYSTQNPAYDRAHAAYIRQENLRRYVEERDRLQEKQEHAGEQGDMYMLRSFTTGNVACVYRSPSEGYDDIHKVLYKSFDDVPVEIKRAVMTLESVERTGRGVANGVGQIGNPVEVLCKEACGFLVPMDFIKEFIQLPAESVHGA